MRGCSARGRLAPTSSATPMSERRDDQFERAREADIEAVAGVKLFRSGRRLRGECPICHASEGKRHGGAFSVDPEARVFKCFGCGAGGDVVRLEQELRGGSLREAAERLGGVSGSRAGDSTGRAVVNGGRTVGGRSPSRPDARLPRRAEGGGASSTAREIWARAQTAPIAETLAGRYLETRGIAAGLIGALAGRLRFHPAAPWGWDEDRGGWITAPAMVAQVRSPAGPTGGVHCTYLAADGRGKARLEPAKRMWGPQKDSEGRPGGVWLSAPSDAGPLIVGEGIESTLSAAQLQGRACRMVATLSLAALQGGLAADRWGRIDPAVVSADPERPAFTWPEPQGAPWGEVLIAVDRDMKPVEAKVRKMGGGTARRRLSAEERARICAGLAVQAWRAAGAARVRAIAPGAGRDFNDELLVGSAL